MVVFLVLLNMEVIVKKNIFVFLLVGAGLSMGLLSSDLNAMKKDENASQKDSSQKKQKDYHSSAVTYATQTSSVEEVKRLPVASTSTAEVPANRRAGGKAFTLVASTPTAEVPANRRALGNVLTPGASTSAAAVPANRQAAVSALKKLLAAPWELGSSITSWITNSTANAEPTTKVLIRCVLEGLLCGIMLYLTSSDALGDAANKRLRLAGFALEDVFSRISFHYTVSRLWTAISGLQYLGTFLGLSGLRFGGWLFGVIIGLRCAYDLFIKLPVSFFFGRPELRRWGYHPFGLDD